MLGRLQLPHHLDQALRAVPREDIFVPFTHRVRGDEAPGHRITNCGGDGEEGAPPLQQQGMRASKNRSGWGSRPSPLEPTTTEPHRPGGKGEAKGVEAFWCLQQHAPGFVRVHVFGGSFLPQHTTRHCAEKGTFLGVEEAGQA